MHLPEQLQIFSDYCPKGKLIFTDELPFIFLHLLISQNSTAILSMGWKKLLEKYTKILDLPSE